MLFGKVGWNIRKKNQRIEQKNQRIEQKNYRSKSKTKVVKTISGIWNEYIFSIHNEKKLSRYIDMTKLYVLSVNWTELSSAQLN